MRKINLYEIAENGGGVELSPFDIKVFHGASNVLRNTDEGAFMTSEIFPANGWEETPEASARVLESLRKIDAAGLLRIPEFHKYEREPEIPEGQEQADGEAKAGKAPHNALHWRVDATDEQGKPLTMAAFYTKSDAEEYAARLGACEIGSWDARVKEIV